MKERLNRLTEVWNALNISQRFSLVGALVGVLLVSAAILSFSGGSKDLRPLVSGADASDLGEVTEVLKSNQIELEYIQGGDSIIV
ncbi:MAG: flagellar M-ring protein FliF, partial [Opitutae bacterium]